ATVLRDGYYTWSRGAAEEQFDPAFNPREYIKQNLSKEDQEALRGPIQDGHFDEVSGPLALQGKIAAAFAEKRLLELEAGSWLGSFAGGAMGILADPLSRLVPGGAAWWRTGNLAVRFGKNVMLGVAQMSPQEAALWAQQDFRTWQQ